MSELRFTLNSATVPTKGAKTQVEFPRPWVITDKVSLIAATKHDHVPFRMGGDRSAANAIDTECLYGDIDNAHTEDPNKWIGHQMIIELFAGIALAIVPSRNHGIDKAGDKKGTSARPRWHVYFPIKLDADKEKVEALIGKLKQRFRELYWDASVGSSGQMFFGSHQYKEMPEELYHIQDGKPITTKLSGPLANPENARRGGRKKTAEDYIDQILEDLKNMTREDIEGNPEWFMVDGVRRAAMLMLARACAFEDYSEYEIVAALRAFNESLKHMKRVDGEKSGEVLADIERMAKWARGLKDDGKLKLCPFAIRNFSYETKKVQLLGMTMSVIDTKPILEPSPAMLKVLKNFMVLEDTKGNRQLVLEDDPYHVINNSGRLSVALLKLKHQLQMRTLKPQTGYTREEMLETFTGLARSVTRMTVVPELEIKERTKYFPVVHYNELTQSNGMFMKYLSDMTFESENDRQRFALGVLSLFLPEYYDGKIPMFVTKASGQNAGKSTVIEVMSRIFTGMDPIMQGGSKEEEGDDNAQFDGVMQQAARVVCYDNMRHIMAAEEKKISKATTLPTRPSWSMGISRARIRNSFVYWMSLNDSQGFGSDLHARVIIIRMMDPSRIPTSERERIDGKLSMWEHESAQALRDDAYFWARKISLERNGVGMGNIILPGKHSPWVKAMGPAMAELWSDVEEFDCSPYDAGHRADPQSKDLEEFILSIMTDEGRIPTFTVHQTGDGRYKHIYFTAKELTEWFNTRPGAPTKDYTVTPSAMGKRLGKLQTNRTWGRLQPSGSSHKKVVWTYAIETKVLEAYTEKAEKAEDSAILDMFAE